MKIALLDDDPDILALLTLVLTRAGHSCSTYMSGNELLHDAHSHSFDAYVVDWMLPDISGLDVIVKLRGFTPPQTVIFVVTGRDDESTVITGLESGADEYLIKPLRPNEFVARLNLVAKRKNAVPQPVTHTRGAVNTWGSYAFDAATRKAYLGDQLLEASPQEFDLAFFMFKNLGTRLERGSLLASAFGRQHNEITRTVDTHIHRVRKKFRLVELGEFEIVCHYGYGYSLQRTGIRSTLPKRMEPPALAQVGDTTASLER